MNPERSGIKANTPVIGVPVVKESSVLTPDGAVNAADEFGYL